MDNNSRMAKNTIILYVNLVVTIVVNLYSTRLILEALGVDDYGIVNLISGIVAMLSFVQNSMTVSTQRFLSVGIAKNTTAQQLEIFNSSFLLHVLLALGVLAVLECCTPLIFNSSIQIPESRIGVSMVLYQLTILGTLIIVLGVPFDASLTAHENMTVVAIASIIESLVRLTGAIVLLNYYYDKLIFYGFLIVLIRLLSTSIKAIYCIRKYEDSRIMYKYSRPGQMLRMLSFAGWNAAGGFAVAARSQGLSIVLNIFKGISINTPYGIANQVAGQLSNFTASITKSMAPQIMQNHGLGQKERMFSLSIKQCKYSFMMLLIAAIPFYLDMPYILHLWLKNVPDYTVAFCRLMLICALIQQLSNGMMTLIQANGKIGFYQCTIAVVICLNIPLAYLMLKIQLPPEVVVVSMIIIEVICLLVRYLFANKLLNLTYKQVIRELGYPVVTAAISSFFTIFLFQNLFIVKLPYFA